MPSEAEEIQQLKDEVARLKAAQSGKLTFKISEKGAMSAYGLQRFPVTLYANQWEALFDHAEAARAFMATHADKLKRK